jgi:hypothetical protein
VVIGKIQSFVKDCPYIFSIVEVGDHFQLLEAASSLPLRHFVFFQDRKSASLYPQSDPYLKGLCNKIRLSR